MRDGVRILLVYNKFHCTKIRENPKARIVGEVVTAEQGQQSLGGAAVGKSDVRTAGGLITCTVWRMSCTELRQRGASEFLRVPHCTCGSQ